MVKIQEFILRYKIFFLGCFVLLILFLIALGSSFIEQKKTVETNKGAQGEKNTSFYDGKQLNQVAQIDRNALKTESAFIYFIQKKSSETIDVYKSDGFSVVSTIHLPTGIRSITPLKNSDLLFISNLGFLDRGETIDRFSTLLQKSETVVNATVGYQIENYLVAPTEDAVVFWEVEENKSTQGKSHVVYQSLADSSKRTLLVDEDLGDQTKYPVLWLSSRNSILADSYSVNRRGLHQGLFEIELHPTPVVREILPKDSYSQTPVAVNSDSQLVYSSYNPSAGVQLPSPAVPNGLFRGTIRNPNEIRAIDLETKQVKTLIPVEDGILYSHIMNPTIDSTIYFSQGKISGTQLQIEKTQWVDLDNGSIGTLTNRPDASIVGVFKGKIIVGFGTGTLGNVGGIETSYSQLYNGVYFFDPTTQSYEKILSDDDITIIGIK